MNAEQFAAMITGREYPFRLSKEEESIAKDNNLLIVYGLSDDLLEVRGAFQDEVSAWGGTIAYLAGKNLVDKDELKDDQQVLRKYGFTANPLQIKLEWCPSTLKTSWLVTVKGGIPFDIMEDGELYCRGAVVEYKP